MNEFIIEKLTEEIKPNSERWFCLDLLKNEEFKDIIGYEGLYQISNYGRVKSLKRMVKVGIKHNDKVMLKEKILKDKDRGNGYSYVILSKESKPKFFAINRLVAQLFLDKNNFKYMPYENKETIKLESLFVNHKDEKPSNNKVNNLEWCTPAYNINYGNCKQKIGKANSKKVAQYDLNMNLIKVWDSCTQIERELGIYHANISNCCTGKQKKSKGYIWKYEK